MFKNVNATVKRFTKRREFIIILAVILVYVAESISNPVFFSFGNQSALFLGMATTLIICTGMTLLYIAGGFDMSVGSNLALSGVVAAALVKAGVPGIAAGLAGILTGALIGLFNGYCSTYIGIAPFVVTLASKNMARGLLVALTRGRSITGIPESFKAFGQGNLLGIQYPIWYAVVVLLIGSFLLKKSKYFRQAYYIGGNLKAATMSGIQAKKVTCSYYVLVGALAGLAGVITAARFGTIGPTTGEGSEMSAITAVVVGGTSMSGGSGTILGTFFGALLIAAINNVINIEGYDVYWQTFISGGTLFVAVFLDRLTMMRTKKQEQLYAEKLLLAGKEKGEGSAHKSN